MHRPQVAFLLSVALALATSCGPGRGGPPDVLLITIDTLRADHLGAYGLPHGTSPRIDALAARGVLFDRGIASAPSTVPSHAGVSS